MSELENRVKSVVERLVVEGNAGLDPAAQTTLAVWATKNAMVFEGLRVDPPWFFTDRERSAFRGSFRPPVRTSVWIAKCTDHNDVYCSAFDLEADLEGAKIQAHLTTMAFGRLAIQVAGGKLPDSFPLATTVTMEQTPGPWEQAAVRIWPSPREVVNWPPTAALRGGRGLEAFENRWGPHSRV